MNRLRPYSLAAPRCATGFRESGVGRASASEQVCDWLYG